MENNNSFFQQILLYKKIILLVFIAVVVLGIIMVIFSNNLPFIKEGSKNQASAIITPKLDKNSSEYLKKKYESVNKDEALAEENYIKHEEDFYSKYPWYDKLPIRTSNYFVYFDIDKQKFIGMLYPKKSTGKPIDELVADMKSEISLKLTTLTNNTTTYPTEWIITPEL